jgi:SAM-dependent MidA family methyltransferase
LLTGDAIVDLIRERGPMTVAAFMDLALYEPGLGYYARAAQRSGRAGDFFTSVDVGAAFGHLLAVQIAEMAGAIDGAFDLVEAGAGNGRLSADILRALRVLDPALLERTRLHLVEASAAARSAQAEVLGDCARYLRSSSADLPDRFAGVLIANELLDALPTHQVVMRADGLREVYVAADGDALTTVEGPLSTPDLERYLAALPVKLAPGWRAEVNLKALDWIRDVARRLERGFAILIDYGHDAEQLYSVTHSAGTLTTYSRHRAAVAGDPGWLSDPGGQDITAHVDFTSVRTAAAAGGLQTIGFMDQTYFVMGILASGAPGLDSPKSRLALKTLLMPGGLGSTMKVLILGTGVGRPALAACSFGMRVT